MYKNDGKTTHLSVAKYTLTRAVQLIACDSHAHLVSKAGSVIGSKSITCFQMEQQLRSVVHGQAMRYRR